MLSNLLSSIEWRASVYLGVFFGTIPNISIPVMASMPDASENDLTVSQKFYRQFHDESRGWS